MLVNGNIRKGQHRSSSAKTTPCGSFTSPTISFSIRSRRKPSEVTSYPMSMEPRMMKTSMLSTHTQKRMPIIIPGANNPTSRENFSAKAIFSYHGFCWLWQHICLKVYVMPGELSVLLNDTIQKGQHRSSSAKTTPRGSGTSHTISILTKCRRKPSGVT